MCGLIGQVVTDKLQLLGDRDKDRLVFRMQDRVVEGKAAGQDSGWGRYRAGGYWS
jgi:hypothetical protein